MRTRIMLVAGALVAAVVPVSLTQSAHADSLPIQSDRISISSTHSLVIAADGKLYGAGDNSTSQLCGAGGRPELSELACGPENVGVTAAAAGPGFTLMVGTDGIAYGLGDNGQGQLTGVSIGTSGFQPMTGLPVGVTATAVAAGTGHSLVLGSDGVVYGTGDNSHGQLTGSGDKTTLTAMALPVGVTATAIAAGDLASIVLGDDGKVYLAGENAGAGIDVSTLTAFAGLPGGVKATAIAAGLKHTLALGDNGVVYATGDNEYDQLATNGGNDLGILGAMNGLPVDVVPVAVAAGDGHSLVLGSDGRIFGAGRNDVGQLTGGSTADVSTLTPLQSAQGAPLDGIAAGGKATLKRDGDDIVYGVGANNNVQLTTNAANGVNAFVLLAGQRPAPISEPAFEGLARYGSTISVSSGDWLAPPTGFTYQWQRNAVSIPGATSASYTPVLADIGKQLDVTIVATRSGFSPGNITVTPGVVAPGPALKYLGTPKPTVGGTARAGSTFRILNLRAIGFKPTATSFKYQWLRNGVAIPGATARTYVLKAADKGKLVKVRITGRRAGYLNGTYTTPARRIAR